MVNQQSQVCTIYVPFGFFRIRSTKRENQVYLDMKNMGSGKAIQVTPVTDKGNLVCKTFTRTHHNYLDNFGIM